MTFTSPPDPRFDTFYRYDALTRLLFDYADAFPDLVSVASIGKSFEGRDIWLATLTYLPAGAADASGVPSDGRLVHTEPRRSGPAW